MKLKTILFGLLIISFSNDLMSKNPGDYFFEFVTGVKFKQLPGNCMTQDLLNYDSYLTHTIKSWLFVLAYPYEFIKNICMDAGKSHFE